MIIEGVRDADPDLALASIDFWDLFLTLDNVVYKEDFKKHLFN
jgi:hypothetical protein